MNQIESNESNQVRPDQNCIFFLQFRHPPQYFFKSSTQPPGIGPTTRDPGTPAVSHHRIHRRVEVRRSGFQSHRGICLSMSHGLSFDSWDSLEDIDQ